MKLFLVYWYTISIFPSGAILFVWGAGELNHVCHGTDGVTLAFVVPVRLSPVYKV